MKLDVFTELAKKNSKMPLGVNPLNNWGAEKWGDWSQRKNKKENIKLNQNKIWHGKKGGEKESITLGKKTKKKRNRVCTFEKGSNSTR